MHILQLISELKNKSNVNQVLKGQVGNRAPMYIDGLGSIEGKNLELGLSDEVPLPKPKYNNVLLKELLNYLSYSTFNSAVNNVFLSRFATHSDGSYDYHYHKVIDIIDGDSCLIIKANASGVDQMKESYPPFDESLYDEDPPDS